MVQLKLVSHCFDLYDFMIFFMWSNLKSIWNYLFTLRMRLNAGCKVGCLHNSLKSSEISKDWGQKFPNTFSILSLGLCFLILFQTWAKFKLITDKITCSTLVHFLIKHAQACSQITWLTYSIIFYYKWIVHY